MLSEKFSFKKSKFYNRMYGSLTLLPPINFAVLDGSYFLHIAFNKLKIAQIVYVNQLFQFLNLVRIYGHGFFELSRMLMGKNVNNDVSKDSPINFWVNNGRSHQTVPIRSEIQSERKEKQEDAKGKLQSDIQRTFC